LTYKRKGLGKPRPFLFSALPLTRQSDANEIRVGIEKRERKGRRPTDEKEAGWEGGPTGKWRSKVVG
jgi:hypothetical protein